MVKAFIFKLIRAIPWRSVIVAWLFVVGMATGVAETDASSSFESDAVTPPLLANGLDLEAFKACTTGLNAQQCQGNQLCIAKYLTTQPTCSQIIPLYNFSHQIPADARVYTNVTVVQLANGTYLLVDSEGQIIAPITKLNLENAPGFLQLESITQQPKLSPQVQGFPAAVYLSQSSNQLLFLQDIMDATCSTNCQPVATAKILYGFNLHGNFINAKVLRIVPPNAVINSPS